MGKDEKPMFECNARITSADITFERGFALDCALMLDYGGTCQGFGGYIIGGDPFQDTADSKHKDQPNFAAEFIGAVLAVAGVERFSQLVGKIIRVRKDDGRGLIRAIGHPIKDIWFNPKERFDALESKAAS